MVRVNVRFIITMSNTVSRETNFWEAYIYQNGYYRGRIVLRSNLWKLPLLVAKGNNQPNTHIQLMFNKKIGT